MMIIMKKDAEANNIKEIHEKIKKLGSSVNILSGADRTIFIVINDNKYIETDFFRLNEDVEKIVPLGKSYKLVARSSKFKSTVIQVGKAEIGSDEQVLIAGPCAIESPEQIFLISDMVKKGGGKILRGGAYKPRTSPYSFEGLGLEGLKLLHEAGKKNDLAVVTEVMETNHIDTIARFADMLQIGSRNMFNYKLLKEVAKVNKPILLKRGFSATIEEWLNAAEHIMNEGNNKVVLCERGIRTFETEMRNTLDLSAVPAIKELSHLPIIVDPSHGTGKWNLVPSMSNAAIASGADGLMIEIHPNPSNALSDGLQSLDFNTFIELTKQLKRVSTAIGRSFG